MLGADALADKNLFLEGAFDDNERKSAGPLLSCEQVVDTKIKNNTCVLGASTFLQALATSDGAAQLRRSLRDLITILKVTLFARTWQSGNLVSSS